MNNKQLKRLLHITIILLISCVLLACARTITENVVGTLNGREQMLDAYLNNNEELLTARNSVDTRPVQFVVEPGTPARVIGQNLKTAGLVQDEVLFEAYVRINGLSSRLAAGTFTLNPSMNLIEVVEILQNARAASANLTIPEGWRYGQIVDTLIAQNIFSDLVDGVSAEAEQYHQQVSVGDLTQLDPSRYPFLQERPAGTSLEGYLFPDTYEIALEKTTSNVLLEQQLENFARRVLPLYKEAVVDGLTPYSLYEVLTIASIVEREAVVPEERATIAGVYLNRLDVGKRLEADPTVQYAMGYQPAPDQWWKTPVSLAEYSTVDSPYNTYLYPGMPPGPICNPGLASIQAVLAPEDHNYLFFVATPDQSGAHVFAETFEEHAQNVQRYQQRQND
ncbi:MAG: endolytic transglycosylase MltG [Chloroflexota bacterium]